MVFCPSVLCVSPFQRTEKHERGLGMEKGKMKEDGELEREKQKCEGKTEGQKGARLSSE